MEANLFQVFNERDTERRLAAIQRTYADDVRWADDAGAVVGHEQLAAKAFFQRALDGDADGALALAGLLLVLQAGDGGAGDGEPEEPPEGERSWLEADA